MISIPLASERSAGKKIAFKGKHLTVQDLADFDFSRAQIGLFSAGASISAQYAPNAAAGRLRGHRQYLAVPL